jgi:hypothetical protein
LAREIPLFGGFLADGRANPQIFTPSPETTPKTIFAKNPKIQRYLALRGKKPVNPLGVGRLSINACVEF